MHIISEAGQVEGSLMVVPKVDLSTAFDRVDQEHSLELLRRCGLGDTLSKYVAICYKDISTRIQVNGCVTQSIAVRSSVRQGWPMSPVLS